VLSQHPEAMSVNDTAPAPAPASSPSPNPSCAYADIPQVPILIPLLAANTTASAAPPSDYAAAVCEGSPWCILVLGATGYVGRHLLSYLAGEGGDCLSPPIPITAGWRLVAGVLPAQEETARGWTAPHDVVTFDFEVPGTTAHALALAGADVVVNCAAIPAVGEYERDPTRSLLSTAQ